MKRALDQVQNHTSLSFCVAHSTCHISLF
uniref:Uncharacterized protein n=1 Tax=Arundo donax TaxID=35708 RepID=A0A0A9ELL9_ARUDO